MIRVLVVEDTPSHLADAVRVAGEMGIEIVTRTYASEAASDISSGHSRSPFHEPDPDKKFDGVVADIYMPYSKDPRWNVQDSPAGLGVAAAAFAHGVPFVICTAGYHHGAKYEWIHSMTYVLKWPLMEGADGHRPDGSYDKDYEAPSKPWKAAFEFLMRRIDGQEEEGEDAE